MHQSPIKKSLRIRSHSLKQLPSPIKRQSHKKQIQQTLNQLHKLQSQIYNLNVPIHPHSNGPLKKEIKQLSYLYQNMTKPKVRNNLDIGISDVRRAIRLINKGNQNQQQTKNKNKIQLTEIVLQAAQKSGEIHLFQKEQKKVQQEPQSNIIQSKTLSTLMKSLFSSQFDLSLISESKSPKVTSISSQQIQKFLLFNQYDNFNPLQQAYKMLIQGDKFSFKKFNQINKILGLTQIKDQEIFRTALGITQKGQMDFGLFCKVFDAAHE